MHGLDPLLMPCLSFVVMLDTFLTVLSDVNVAGSRRW